MTTETSSSRHPDREYLGDEFVQAWIERQVITKTDEYLARLRGIAGAIVVVTLGVFGYFGYQLLDLRQELIDKVAQASQNADEAKANVQAAQSFLKQAEALSGSTFKNVNDTIGLTSRSVEQSTSAVGTLSTALGNLRGQEEQIARAQAALADQARGFESQRTAMASAFTQQRQEVEGLVSRAQASVSNTLDSEGKVARVAGNLAQVQDTYTRLLERHQVEYAFLRSHDSRILNLYSFGGRDGKAFVQHYQVMVSVDDIKDRINLDVTVVDDGSGKPTTKRTFSQLRQSETPIPIDGTPFVFRVEFIYHAKMAIDFVVVKVQAADRPV